MYLVIKLPSFLKQLPSKNVVEPQVSSLRAVYNATDAEVRWVRGQEARDRLKILSEKLNEKTKTKIEEAQRQR